MDSNIEIVPGTVSAAGDLRAVFGHCPTHWLIRQLSDRWSLPVLSALRSSPKRFTELLLLLAPISRRMLDRTLKKLLQIGLVSRVSGYAVSRQAHYEITDLGRTVEVPLWRLISWSQRHGTIAMLRAGCCNQGGVSDSRR